MDTRVETLEEEVRKLSTLSTNIARLTTLDTRITELTAVVASLAQTFKNQSEDTLTPKHTGESSHTRSDSATNTHETPKHTKLENKELIHKITPTNETLTTHTVESCSFHWKDRFPRKLELPVFAGDDLGGWIF